MEKMLKLVPKEIKGEIWDKKGSSEVTEILISNQKDIINAFQFTCSIDGKLFPSHTYGEPTGLYFKTVKIDYPKEFLTSVSGAYKQGRLASIVFGTNHRKFGPFGWNQNGSSYGSSDTYDDFSYEFGPRNCFGGFHGSVIDGSVYAFGVYVKLYVARLTT